MEPLEAAFSMGQTETDWWARITWKCAICGRRNSKLFDGSGQMPLPMEVVCKLNHQSLVVPYRWNPSREE